MQERTFELAGGSLHYEVKDGKVWINGYVGTDSEVVIPGELDGCPVTVLGKKAFLSRKQLRKITLPDTLEEIGDWVFAYCSNLREVSLPDKRLAFGKTIFQECTTLGRIVIRRKESDTTAVGQGNTDQGTAELLAAAVTAMDSYYLLDTETAGSKEWLRKWDARLLALMHASDTDGYSKQVLCGEEDYGSTDLNNFIREKRKGKVRLALLRLLYPMEISADLRIESEQYLLAHTAGSESDETWQVIWKEHGDDRAYYSLFQELGCVNNGNLDKILSDVGNNYPEMKAFFLSGSNTAGKAEAFFDDLDL